MKHDPNEVLSAVAPQAMSAATAYKTLLVPVDASERSARSIEVACRLGARFDAHVIGLYVQPTSYIPPELYAYGSTASLAQFEEQMQQLADAARATFDSASSRSSRCSLEWRACKGDAAAVVMTHARYADLVIISQMDPNTEGTSNFVDTLLMSVHRPILLVPYVGNLSMGTRILVCWNASHEAARAVTDALPLLQSASRVTVLTIDARPYEAGHGKQPGMDLALFLARHGVKADVKQSVSSGLDHGNVILSRAADEGSDLIVMGAYGHSRLRETILGGATRTVLRSMTVPVLMSH